MTTGPPLAFAGFIIAALVCGWLAIALWPRRSEPTADNVAGGFAFTNGTIQADPPLRGHVITLRHGGKQVTIDFDNETVSWAGRDL